jgi:1-pyrroline-5-carboxylate dehydrogenase
VNYESDNHEWEGFCRALEKMPRNLDIPMFLGEKEVYTDTKIPDISPISGEVIATAQKATPKHVEEAMYEALAAKTSWAMLPLEHRIAKFRDLEQSLYSRRHEICAALAVECGYSLTECAADWAEIMDFLRFNPYYYHELSQTKLGEGLGESNALHLRALKGFTCAVTPFNFPVAIGYNLPMVMALCGNTVVWKPSSDTPLVSWILMQALKEADFPPGVINMLSGPSTEIMPAVFRHPELTAVNFTGSDETARFIASVLYSPQIVRPHFPRFVAETGGKGFMVVDERADLYDVAACIVQGAFGRAGQKCSANSLIFCHKKVWADLKCLLLERLKNFKTGNPLERGVHMGPVINQQAFDKITGFIQRAVRDSQCDIFAGGGFDNGKGWFIQPTCIQIKKFPHELLEAEIFGPVVSFYLYEKVSEVIEVLDTSKYRLTGAIWSSDENWLAQYLPLFAEYAGNLYVNRKTTGAVVDCQPFGGDGSSGTNSKVGGMWYLLNFISQGIITRRHLRVRRETAVWEWVSH